MTDIAQSRWASVYDRPSQDYDRTGQRMAEAFEDLFAEHEQKIFNAVYRMIGNYEDAADLTAETFARALRGFDSFRGDAQPYTWLYRIALNLCKNYFRQQQHRSRVHAFSLDSPTDVEGELMGREIEDQGPSPHEQVEARELEEKVAACLITLRPEFRTLVVLRDIQGLSYQEIGEVLGCSEKAVKSRLFRARMQLREALHQHDAKP